MSSSATSIEFIRYDGSYPYGVVRTDKPLGGGVYRAWLFGAAPHHTYLGCFDNFDAAKRALLNEYILEMGHRTALAIPSNIATSSLGDL